MNPNAGSEAYSSSKAICSVNSAAEVAKTYGGSPGDLESVARAYAAESYVPDVRAQGEAGCLAGLRSR